MIEVSIEEAKIQLAALLEQVATGEEIIIFESGKPVAKLIKAEKLSRFHFGQDAGKGWVADDFDAPLPDDIQAYFEGRGE